jgi:F-type H+-transporting ATPase subunit alpha
MTEGRGHTARQLDALGPLDLRSAFRVRGAVAEVADGVAQVVGLNDVGYEELVAFDSGAWGIAYDLSPQRTGVVLISGAERVRAQEGASTTGELPALRVGDQLCGRLINPLGQPLDGGPASPGDLRPIFREAPELMERAPISKPLLTGVMALDAAIPIGRGQRQLIVGDRDVGKTALALDIVAAQRSSGVVCVYVAIGQPLSRVLGVREALAERGALAHTVVVAAEAAEPPGMQHLAPYAGMAVAEHFCAKGRDALVIYDDLTKHANAYRELALLLGRPPGREAFPGDIFYVHAQLLERATAFDANEGGSVTALPIVETTDSDISAYIPTNLISITDGQIYLDVARFERNQRPAIDVGKSVSRIGGAAQPHHMRHAALNLRIDLARLESLEGLTRVGLDVDARTQRYIERGRVLRELLRQPRFTVRAMADQVMVLSAVAEGWLDGLNIADAARVSWEASRRAKEKLPAIARSLESGEELPDDWRDGLSTIFRHAREGSSS